MNLLKLPRKSRYSKLYIVLIKHTEQYEYHNFVSCWAIVINLITIWN